MIGVVAIDSILSGESVSRQDGDRDGSVGSVRWDDLEEKPLIDFRTILMSTEGIFSLATDRGMITPLTMNGALTSIDHTKISCYSLEEIRRFNDI